MNTVENCFIFYITMYSHTITLGTCHLLVINSKQFLVMVSKEL